MAPQDGVGDDPTTLFYEAGYTPYIARGADPVLLPWSTPSTVVPGGFTLYVKQDIPAATGLDVSFTSPPVYYGTEYITRTTTLDAIASGTLLVPYTTADLPTEVRIGELPSPWLKAVSTRSTRLRSTFAPTSASGVTTNSADSVTGPVPSTTSSSTGPGVTDSAVATAATSLLSVSGSTGGSSGTGSIGPGPTSATTGISKTTLNGAVAGGMIGGIILGVATCLLVTLCCFRHRKTSSPAVARNYTGERANVESATEKRPRATESAMPVTGWQKHLPQDKDHRTIRDTFQTLFEHIQMHVDGFYGRTPGTVSNGQIDSIRAISEDKFHGRLLAANDPLPALEAIIARYIIHRISLRSSATESLLPSEYTTVPESCEWDMEQTEQDKSVSISSKRGFLQAVSQWRMLTGFLHPDPRSDQKFKVALDAKVNNAVQALNDALSPWELSKKDPTNRFKSLQSILQEASQAGIMLFQQRSLYVFDWSSGRQSADGSVAITPALVKKMDESGEAVHPAQTLVTARWTKV